MHNVNTRRCMAVLTRVIRSRKRLLQIYIYICGIIQIDDELQSTGPLWGQLAKKQIKKKIQKTEANHIS